MRRTTSAAPASLSRKSLALTAVVAAAGALALSGCQTQSPVQTLTPYQPGDGISVDVGTLKLRDLVVVSAAKGAPGVLSGAVVNSGTQPVTLTFATQDGEQASRDVPANSLGKLWDDATPVTLPRINRIPGELLELEVATPAGGSVRVRVPVLLPDNYYRTITPPSGATAAPSASPSPSATSTP